MRNSIRENKKCMRDGEIHASGYKATTNWWGLGKNRSPVGRTSYDASLWAPWAVQRAWADGGRIACPLPVRQLPPTRGNWSDHRRTKPSRINPLEQPGWPQWSDGPAARWATLRLHGEQDGPGSVTVCAETRPISPLCNPRENQTEQKPRGGLHLTAWSIWSHPCPVSTGLFIRSLPQPSLHKTPSHLANTSGSRPCLQISNKQL